MNEVLIERTKNMSNEVLRWNSDEDKLLNQRAKISWIKGYNTKGGPPRCMLQMDLQKACAIVEWCALEAILKEPSFPNKFIRLIM